MDLLVDSNLAHMFGPEGAALYFARLLKVDVRSLRPTMSQEWPHAFFITNPTTITIADSERAHVLWSVVACSAKISCFHSEVSSVETEASTRSAAVTTNPMSSSGTDLDFDSVGSAALGIATSGFGSGTISGLEGTESTRSLEFDVGSSASVLSLSTEGFSSTAPSTFLPSVRSASAETTDPAPLAEFALSLDSLIFFSTSSIAFSTSFTAAFRSTRTSSSPSLSTASSCSSNLSSACSYTLTGALVAVYASPSGSSEKSSEGGREKPTKSLVRAERISWMI